MKVTADTNILVRALMQDDARQAAAAMTVLSEAETIAISLSSLCELVCVLRRIYNLGKEDILIALTTLVSAENVAVDRAAVEAGFAVLQAGGDFADGVIAFEGRWLGGETFVSFDKKAVSLLTQQGQSAQLLS
ncbi:type II toxin-antitoxin system VapC family toxin [Acidisoma cellulosilytica]|uniref:Type II toxin-antitoxin system VapC family toxin n=1 Tax=Acidisoma cellulosilyticum TaxID=2802395 RepID=A0A963Z0R7_9PROT|nr:type II toxin-antitoxin system VapC family toxin [Acidisoma cellulosilyticum]MCB8880585.1 type II toxin-antitoxin system VapC family toxin [Acidisoma cellulosilyticum]